MAAAVCKYREERAARMPAAAGPIPAAQRDAASSQPVKSVTKSIAELDRVFALLNGSLLELLAATLDGWKPPRLSWWGRRARGRALC
jgi:hypothetical protein